MPEAPLPSRRSRGHRAHPLFARCYHVLSGAAERAGSADHRRELLEGLRGEVIEIGAGNGLNFAYYPPEVTAVLAVEPDPYLRRQAARAAARALVTVRVVEGWADNLPAGDGRFDAAVASLVLCSVPSPPVALAELLRVLRPGGELRFYEHVRSEDPGDARWQDRVEPLWSLVGGGCHPSRDTVAAIRSAGFDVEQERRFSFEPSRLTRPVAPHVIGRARRPMRANTPIPKARRFSG
jgi:SAM-dependent methyltransferase